VTLPEGTEGDKGPSLPFCNKIIKELYDSEPTEIEAEVELSRDVVSDNEAAEEEDDNEGIDAEEMKRCAKVMAMQK
jgi:hypothetical protein